MLRVTDLERSISFFTDVMGMRLLRRTEYPSGRFTLAFVGYGDENETAVIELTYNWDTQAYELGTGYGHIAIEVANIYGTCDTLKSKGVNIIRAPGPLQDDPSEVIAFITDPDGYLIELIQDKSIS
jgi:lactoylglutathione lyase